MRNASRKCTDVSLISAEMRAGVGAATTAELVLAYADMATSNVSEKVTIRFDEDMAQSPFVPALDGALLFRH
jgi:hypothetical protein